MKSAFLASALLFLSSISFSAENIFSLKYTSIQGQEKSLADFKGKVLLLVNTASECGYTKQYEGLEKLYKKFEGKGLTVIGFPSPSFDQELKSDEDVAKFCKLKYGVTFPLSKRIAVKGKDIDPVFKYLTTEAGEKGDVQWNFEKFLVDRHGQIVARFRSKTTPEEIATHIEKLL